MECTFDSAAVTARIHARSERRGACFIWTGALAKNGYGYMSVNNKVQPVHRLAYLASHGFIPDGQDIDHVCFNRACVEPSHLRAVTRKQNMEHLRGAYVTSKTRVRGVSYWETRKAYVAEVTHHGKRVYRGYFSTLEEAEATVKAERARLFTHDDAR
ncbi:HNH endonuclease signature motif containing protein [Micrococcus luteus]|uniref:HNH endonuclease signature motif containing protein n=1 Tax=Micrococcus luteus TaxID=1270 RepID=UPI003D3410B0